MLKKGFNLIELAIVLAVIGLVIGGIYTAASAVNQRNLIEAYDRQISTIMRNLRSAYIGQKPPSGMIQIPYATLKALQIMPSDIIDTGSGYLTPNNYQWIIYFTTLGAGRFGIVLSFYLPEPACVSYLTRHYGTPAAMRAENMVYVVTATGAVNSSTGVTPNDATIMCEPGDDNFILLAFSVL